jgi:mannosylglucosylglycerate synthase
MHHHDPPWQRERFAHIDELPMTDGAWRHVTINELTRHQMADRGITAVTIYNPFETDEPFGDRDAMRAELGVVDEMLLLAHPVRAIARKNIPTALRLAEQLGATYWLLGPAEEGYDDQLAWLLSTATVPVIHRAGGSIADIYAAADGIVFPSLWEGFGNPPIEAAIHRRPVIVGDYPVAYELEALGFRWFRASQLDDFAAQITTPDTELLDHNRELALEKFSIAASRDRIGALIEEAGWL